MMHCEPCLRAEHRFCRVMLPAEWEDDHGRCICKCAVRDATRLTNIERKCEEMAAKAAPRKRAKGAGRPIGASKWTDAAIQHLCELERQGMTSRQIGVVVGAHMDTVRTYLSKARKKGWR